MRELTRSSSALPRWPASRRGPRSARVPVLVIGIGGLALVGFAWAAPGSLFPVEDLAARLRLVSLIAGASVVALTLWRSLASRRNASAASVEVVAAVAGVITVALSRSFVGAATGVGLAAMGALLALGTLALAERVARAPADRRSGLALALLMGLCAGGPLAAAALGWPLAALILMRAFRRADRSSSSSPTLMLALAVFFVGLTIGLTVSQAIGLWGAPRGAGSISPAQLGGRMILLPVFRALTRLSPRALVAAAIELCDQVGVLAAMVALAGLSGLRRTSLIFTLWSLAAGLVLRAAFGAGVDGALGLMLALSALALPLGAGIVRLAERLGRARLPAAGALGVIVATWPFLAR